MIDETVENSVYVAGPITARGSLIKFIPPVRYADNISQYFKGVQILDICEPKVCDAIGDAASMYYIYEITFTAYCNEINLWKLKNGGTDKCLNSASSLLMIIP